MARTFTFEGIVSKIELLEKRLDRYRRSIPEIESELQELYKKRDALNSPEFKAQRERLAEARAKALVKVSKDLGISVEELIARVREDG